MSQHHPGEQTPEQYPAELQPHNPNPTGTAATLYEALRATAQLTGQARGYVRSTTHVTLHVPLEVVALSIGRHRVTVWRLLPQLRALGLVDARPHKTTALDGRTVNSGTLWAVRLDPAGAGAARLTHEELKHEWRDLDRDRRRRRTAHRAVQERMQQSKELPECGYDLELLLAWALPPRHSKTPLNMTVAPARADLEAVLDLPHVAVREERAAAVNGAAQALSGALGDPGGLNFYRFVLWQLLRLPQHAGEEFSRKVYHEARRARADAAEGFARRPGALFTARLKRCDWWDELVRASGRVGAKPL